MQSPGLGLYENEILSFLGTRTWDEPVLDQPKHGHRHGKGNTSMHRKNILSSIIRRIYASVQGRYELSVTNARPGHVNLAN